MATEKRSFKEKLKWLWGEIKIYAARLWAYLKAAKMEYIVMVSLFAVDLISKAIVNATTSVGEVVVLIPKFLNIHNIHNYDAAFGSDLITGWLGSVGTRILFSVFAVAATVVFIIILVKQKGKSRVFRISLAMLAAGAMGNCIDRWALGYVRDFVEFVYFGLTIGGMDSFYVFNIADAALVIGVVLVVVYFIFIYKDKSEKKPEPAAEVNASTESAESGETAASAAESTADGDVEAASIAEDMPDGEEIADSQEGNTSDCEATTNASEVAEGEEKPTEPNADEDDRKSDGDDAVDDITRSDGAADTESEEKSECADPVQKPKPRTRKKPKAADGGAD